MTNKIKQLSALNWVLVSVIIALACVAIVVITRLYQPGDVPVSTTATGPSRDDTPATMAQSSMAENPTDCLIAGARELEQYLPDDLESWILWQRRVGEYKAATLAPEGGLYLITESLMLYAIGADGAVRWTETFPGNYLWGPVVDQTGNVFVCDSTTAYAYTADGELRWEYKVPGLIRGNPIVDSKGNLVVKAEHSGESTKFIMAISSTGEEKWTYYLEYESSHSGVQAGTRGRVYDMGKGGVFQTLTHIGTRGWGLGMNDQARGPAVDDRGLLYLAAIPDPEVPGEWLLMCLEPQMGKEVWHVELPNCLKHGPLVTGDGRVYVLCQPPESNYLHPLPILVYGRDGNLLWNAAVLNASYLVCPPAADNPLAVVTSDGAIFLNPDGTILFSLSDHAGHPTPVLISPNNIAYCHHDGVLVAIDLRQPDED